MTQFVVESVLHNLKSLIQKEFTPFLSFHQDLRKLADLFTTIKASLEDAEEKQFSDRYIYNWVRKINDAAHMVDDIIDECACEALGLEYHGVEGDLSDKVQCSYLSSFHPKHVVFDCKMAKKMKRISKRIIELVEENNKFHLTETLSETGMIAGRRNEVTEGRRTTIFFGEPRIYERHEDKNKLIGYLTMDPYALRNVLSVYSIEGPNGFGKTTFSKLIFNDLLVVNHFELRIWVCGLSNFSLKEMIEAITKAAIGCDCEDLDLELLQIKLQYLLQRKRYLIVLDFKLFPEDQSWQGLQTFRDDWERLKSVLACGKVGASILVIALNCSTIAEIMGIGPRETIRKQYLIELWMANGFISTYGRLDAANVGEDVWNELYKRLFFQDIERDEFGNIITFKMNDFVTRLAIFVAKDVEFLTDNSGGTYYFNRTHHLSNYRWRIELRSYELQKLKYLRIYLIPNLSSHQLSPNVLKCHSLRVLELRLKGELSPSIGDLKHLRYLNLSKSDFKTLPEFLCKLWNLQILILDYCKHLQKLPKSLIDLKSLEKLSFEGCHKLSSLPPQMGKLTSLRSLTSYFVGSEKGFLLAELGGMNLEGDLDMNHLEKVENVDDVVEANMSSKRLNELRLSWDKNEETKLGNNVEEILEKLQPDTQQLVSLIVTGYTGGHFPRWVFGPSLKKLHIERCRELKSLDEALQAMTALQSLRLYDLPNLESLPNCFQRLRSLRQIAIGFCCKLTSFPYSLKVNMLERLDIYACPALEKQLCDWSTIVPLPCKISVDGCLITKGKLITFSYHMLYEVYQFLLVFKISSRVCLHAQ
ncbi:hypothetical protein VNO80_09937 [Phaseolus coccineus]|uniref:Uncharacterized protein n=1 Tax=Phaseolus coccineus TaxID=3886 RepID=A0AAN9N7P5_PHACN